MTIQYPIYDYAPPNVEGLEFFVRFDGILMLTISCRLPSMPDGYEAVCWGISRTVIPPQQKSRIEFDQANQSENEFRFKKAATEVSMLANEVFKNEPPVTDSVIA